MEKATRLPALSCFSSSSSNFAQLSEQTNCYSCTGEEGKLQQRHNSCVQMPSLMHSYCALKKVSLALRVPAAAAAAHLIRTTRFFCGWRWHKKDFLFFPPRLRSLPPCSVAAGGMINEAADDIAFQPHFCSSSSRHTDFSRRLRGCCCCRAGKLGSA